MVSRGGRRRRGREVRGRCAIGLVLLGVLVSAGAGRAAALRSEDDVDSVRALLKQIKETRATIAEAKQSWADDREFLVSRIDLLKGEIETIRQETGATKASGVGVEADLAKLEAEEARLRQSMATLETAIGPLEERLRALLPKLPSPLANSETVRSLSTVIAAVAAPGPSAASGGATSTSDEATAGSSRPSEPEPIEGSADSAAPVARSLGERFAALVTIANAINKFQREITTGREQIRMADGSKLEVQTLYLGLGQGYYVGLGGTVAGVGTATVDGWRWTSADGAAESIAAAIKIREGEPARFVPLPVRIQ